MSSTKIKKTLGPKLIQRQVKVIHVLYEYILTYDKPPVKRVS
jgi:hypothetical protein